MPPLLGRTNDARTPQQLLAEVVRSAAAFDPSRGICDLAAATSRQLLELERPFGLLLEQCGGPFLTNIPQETLAALEVSPAARAALVQLFSSALRLLASDDSTEEAGRAPTSSKSHSNSSAVGPRRPPLLRPGGSAGTSSSTSSPATSGRPAGPSPQRFLGIFTATAHLLTKYLEEATVKQEDAFGNEFSLVHESTPTLLALLRGDALEGLSRLLAVERDRSAGAKLLTGTHEIAIKEFLFHFTKYAAFAVCSEGGRDSPLCLAAIHSLSRSHVLEQWSAHTLRRLAPAPAASAAIEQDQRDLWMLDLTFKEFRGVGRFTSHAAAAAAVRQLLSGPYLQYCMAVHAVSQLHAADGGPLYGLPYDALLPAVIFKVRTGSRGRPLSYAPLACALQFWGACLSQRPPVLLRPLRPRHLLALCLRTARAALGSLGGEATAVVLGRRQEVQGEVQQRQQQQQQQQRSEESRLGGAAGVGRAAGAGLVWIYGSESWGLRQSLILGKCPELALSAMTLTTKLLSSRTCGNNSTTSSSGSSSGQGRCEERDVVPAEAATDPAGGASGSSCAEATPAAIAAAAASGVSVTRSAGAGGGTGDPPLDLLRDPGFAAEWWRLAVGAVRATLRHGEQQQQRHQQQHHQQTGTCLQDTRECLELLQAGLEAGAGAGGSDPWVGSPSLEAPAAALDAGYIPCMEAVIRHMYGRYGALVTDLNATFGALSTPDLLLVPRLLRAPSSHTRQAAALISTLAKVLVRCSGVQQGRGEQKGVAAGGTKAAAAGAVTRSQRSGLTISSTVAGYVSVCLATLACDARGALLRLSETSISSLMSSSSSAARNAGLGSGGCRVEGPDSGKEGCSSSDGGDGEHGAARPSSNREGLAAEAGTVVQDSGGARAESKTPGKGDSDGGRAPLLRPVQDCHEPTLQLVGFALPRWLPLCAHLADACGPVQEEEQGERQGPQPQEGQEAELQPAAVKRGVLMALRGGISLVLDACTATHEAGDWRALGSWRQLLYDMGSCRWVDERDAEMAGRETRWCDRGWSPGQAVGPPKHQHQQQQERKSQRQREQQQRERGTEAEADVHQGQRDGGAADGVAESVRRTHGYTSGLQQQGTEQEEGETEEPEQQRQGTEEQQQSQELREQEGQEQQEKGQEQQGQEREQEQEPQCGMRPAGDGPGLHIMLPPPCDAGLLLPTCCHPLCTNLAGDCEAGLQLGPWGGGAEGGGGEGGGEGSSGSLYCSRECRTAHARFRREQEAKELGWRVRRWGQGS